MPPFPPYPHHILGRGYDFGFRADAEGRETLSSICNFAPIGRDIHKGPQRDSREMRHLFLRLVKERVVDAIRDDRYELQQRDRAFLQIAEEWAEENSC